jgi:GNAT superfamily N-acetyltransferase
MYTQLDTVTLKTGESVELGVAMGPDTQLGEAIFRLLGHKGRLWDWQIRQSLDRDDLGMQSRFYVLMKAGVPVSNICSFEVDGIGILGHVYTVPQERQKGAANILMKALLADFDRRGGKALVLGTEYDTHPYHLYAKHGFVGIEPDNGYMLRYVGGQEGFEKQYFAPAAVTVEPATFKHWPTVSALTLMKHPARVRLASLGIHGPISAEGPMLAALMPDQPDSERVQMTVASSKATGAALAAATVRQDPFFGKGVDVLDVFFAPACTSAAEQALAALTVRHHAVAYTDTRWPERDAVLASLGFAPTATLAGHLTSPAGPVDVTVWTRR